jgi:hypothetical protein
MDPYRHILDGYAGKGKISMDPVVPPEPDAPNSGNRHYGGPYTRKKKLIKDVAKLKLNEKPSGRVCVSSVWFRRSDWD